jgi:hypothetical protein
MRTLLSRLIGLSAGLLASLFTLALAPSALAQYYYPPPPPPPPGYYAPARPPAFYPPPPPPPVLYVPPPKVLTLLFEPLMLAPIEQGQEFLELSAEFRVQRWLGLDLIGGFGSWVDNTLAGANGEVGLEVNFYPFGGFRGGLQLAPFARYTFDGAGSSLEWGGLVGYKWVAWSGFTCQVQAGLGVLETLVFSGNLGDQSDGLVPNDIGWFNNVPGQGGSEGVALLRFGIGWSL